MRRFWLRLGWKYRDNFWLKWLDSLPWNTLFIDGNHENFDVLNTYPVEEYKGGKVHRIRSKVFHLMRGEVFNIDGYKFFTMGGGFSHDVNYRTEHKNWWKDEICTIEEAKHAFATLEKNNWEVDYIFYRTIHIHRIHWLINMKRIWLYMEMIIMIYTIV